MIKLQDIIQYYIGCRVLVDDENYGRLLGGDFIPNSVDQIYYTILIDGEDEDSLNVPYNDDFNDEELRIKPILRKLDSLTVGEAIDLYKITLLNGKGVSSISDEDNFDVSVIKDNNGICSFQVVFINAHSLHFNININGDVLVYNHELASEPNISNRVYNQHFVTHYLIKAGFDVFKLIPRGLAIDSKTLK